ncbi:hypothetical protein J6590_049841 [Homalodisca vitripennis]|nr:hypothetical protein J6590_049841 [Homalodisca vitripennis]
MTWLGLDLVVNASVLLKRLHFYSTTSTANKISMRLLSNSAISSRLKGKVAVVTASTDGIGFAIAKRLGAEGANVVVSSRKEKNVSEAVKKLKDAGYNVAGTVCHVAKADDRRRLLDTAVEHYGGIDILVSNAAVNPTVGPVLDCAEEAWDKIFEVNVKSAFMLSKEVLPYLKKRNGGSIVYISSIAGFHPLNVSRPTEYYLTLQVLIAFFPALNHFYCLVYICRFVFLYYVFFKSRGLLLYIFF